MLQQSLLQFLSREWMYLFCTKSLGCPSSLGSPNSYGLQLDLPPKNKTITKFIIAICCDPS